MRKLHLLTGASLAAVVAMGIKMAPRMGKARDAIPLPPLPMREALTFHLAPDDGRPAKFERAREPGKRARRRAAARAVSA